MIPLRQQIRIAYQVLDSVRQAEATVRQLPWDMARGVITQADRLSVLLRRYGKTRLLSLSKAEGYLLKQIPDILNELNRQVGRVQDAIHQNIPPRPGLRDVLGDLQQLEKEFDDLMYLPGWKRVCVTTEPITLEGVALGPFRLSVDLEHLAEGLPEQFLKAEAFEPNPPASDSSVTHPHVSNDRICTGEGSFYLTQAARQGRLADIFTIARNILTTYNPESPYVELGNWYGRSCYDCGDTTDEEDGYGCSGCGEFFCSHCIGFCIHCDEAFCERCLRLCEECHRPLCDDCRRICPECEKIICESCLDEGCSCQEKDEDSNDETTETTGSEQSPADTTAAA